MFYGEHASAKDLQMHKHINLSMVVINLLAEETKTILHFNQIASLSSANFGLNCTRLLKEQQHDLPLIHPKHFASHAMLMMCFGKTQSG